MSRSSYHNNLAMESESASANSKPLLPTLFQIDKKYTPGSDNHYCFRYLADPFVDGPSRSNLAGMKLSAMKGTVFEKQYHGETISLMRMIFSDCGDTKSSDLLKKFDKSPEISFAGRMVQEEKRESYNFRRLMVTIASKLDTQTNDMVTYLQEEVSSESAGSDFQTLLLLFTRARQGSIILPQKLDRLKQWLGDFNRDDLIRYVNQFEPKKQFPGLIPPMLVSSTDPGLQRQCSDTTGQISATVAKVSQSTGAVGTLTKEPSTDSAYAEGDSRERSASHGDPQSLASYGSSDPISKLRSDSVEEKGPREVAEMVSGMKIK